MLSLGDPKWRELKGTAEIDRYYAATAASYDASRFGGSYGRFLDRQERAILRSWLAGARDILDVGCGTGRMLELATCGLDPCAEMLTIARARYPTHGYARGVAWAAPFRDGSFDAVFSLHLFMHLARPEIERTVAECLRLLRPGGVLIFDVPSAPRRALTGYRPSTWRCATAFSPEELESLCGAWHSICIRGFLATPLHRIPPALRPLALPLDTLLGRTPLRRWCSYFAVRLEKPR
jgi:SAM-dependent methyltransferase